MLEEVNMLTDLCYKFGKLFLTYFPHRNITRKIHEFVFHLPRFVEKHRTIGLLSEQEGESKHAAVNAELRPLACMRNHAERLHMVLEREELRSVVNKKLLRSNVRICDNCKCRVFLRAGNDGKRGIAHLVNQFFKVG